MNVDLADGDDLLGAAVAVDVVLTEDHAVGVAASRFAIKQRDSCQHSDGTEYSSLSSLAIERMHAKRARWEPHPLPVHAVGSSHNPAWLNQASSASVVVAASGSVLKRDLRREQQRIQNSTHTDP